MSKKIRKVKKKPAKGGSSANARTRHISMACRKTLNDMYLMRSSVHETIERLGMDAMYLLLANKSGNTFTGVKGTDDLSVGTGLLEEDLKVEVRDWQYWAAILVEGDENGLEVESTWGMIKSSVLGEVGQCMPEIIADINPELNDGNILGWCWCLAPTMGPDLNSSEDEIIRYLIDTHDILNQEKRARIKALWKQRGSEDETTKAIERGRVVGSEKYVKTK